MPAPAPRASLYVRLSKESSEENVSLDAMVKQMRDLVAREGLTEVALHVDDGSSGAQRDRVGLGAWLKDAEEGRADVLVMPSVDRATREGISGMARLMDLVEGKDSTTGKVVRKPVRLIDTEGLDSEHGGEGFQWAFMAKGLVARGERDRIAARNKRKAKALAEQGRFGGGVVPFGYRAVANPEGPGKVLDLEPREADVIREAARRVLAGQSLRSITAWVASQCPPRRAKEWSRNALWQVLTGDSVLGRQKVQGGLVVKDGEPWAPYPPVLDLVTAMEVRERLVRTPDARKRPGRPPTYVFSGLLVCYSCGRPMTGTTRSRGKGKPKDRQYRCATRADATAQCAKAVTIAAPMVEEHLVGLLMGAMGDTPATERRVITSRPTIALATATEVHALALERVGKDPSPEAVEALREAHALLEAAKQAPAPEPRVEWVPTGRTVREEWEARDVEGRRAIAGRFFMEVVVHPAERRGHFDPSRLTVTTVADAEREADAGPWWDVE